MNKTAILLAASLAVLSFASCAQENELRLIQPVNFSEVEISDSFWTPRLQMHKDVTIPVCIDQIENKTGRIRNFENAAKHEGTHSGIYFDDSDVYKALEGFAYSLQNNPDPQLEAKCDEWIDKFAAAQEPDGYLNTFYTLTGIENRWTDMGKHEMYCAGHMIEAAVAYYNVTGKKKLLEVCEKFVKHMMDTFGPGKRDWIAGHQEIELALIKLYNVTGKKEYVGFADWILSERGHGLGYKLVDGQKVYFNNDKIPVREQREPRGHAVRAMYQYCGMADVAACTGDTSYVTALKAIWEDMVSSRMYITGGIGSVHKTEGFGEPFSLPNMDAYCETCASVGMVLWNWRMNRFTGEAKYVDIMEKALYNGVLAGISLSGDHFFYVNPLESPGWHHRQEWYGCACCPSQLCRFIPSIGNYIYCTSDKVLWVNMFIGNKSAYMSMETGYPWDGQVTMKVGELGASKKEIRVRIPEWCKNWTLTVKGETFNPSVENGYAVIPGRFKEGDIITLSMDMPVELVSADPRVVENLGKRAVQRGPVVYCIEEVDNPSIDDIRLSSDEQLVHTFDGGLLGGVVRIDSDNIHYIPYYSWDNREAGKMKVWVDYSE